MKLSHSKALANCGNLRSRLKRGEIEAFGPKPGRAIICERESMIKAISGNRSSNLRIGQLVASYRNRYKPDHTWMPLGRAIAHALGYRSYTSLNSLMEAADRAWRIPILLRDAVIEAGIDPTESKYNPLVDELRNADFSGTRKEACAFVHAAIESFKASRKEAARKRRQDNSASDAETGTRIARQVAIRLRKTSPGERRTQAKTIVHQLAEALRQEFPECIISLAWVENDATAQPPSHRKQASAPRLVHSSGRVAPIRNLAIGAAGSFATKSSPAAETGQDEAKADLASVSPEGSFVKQPRSTGSKPPKRSRDNYSGFLPFEDTGS